MSSPGDDADDEKEKDEEEKLGCSPLRVLVGIR